MDHPNENMAQTNAPQEVVLRYEAPVTPIVERYVQPTPLPGRKNAPPSPPRPSPTTSGAIIPPSA